MGGLWLARMKLRDMILLDEGRKQGEFQKKINSVDRFSRGDSFIIKR